MAFSRYSKPAAATSAKAPRRVSVSQWVQTAWGPEQRTEVLPEVYHDQKAAWAAIRAMPPGSFASAQPVPAGSR